MNYLLPLLINAAIRAPRLMIAALLLALAVLAGSLSYAGYLVVSVLAASLDIGRIAAGLLLAVLFARLPAVREGKLRMVGLLPGRARLPVVLALLAFCCVSFVRQGEWMPALFLLFAAGFAVAYRRIKQKAVGRVQAFVSETLDRGRPGKPDDDVIDVEFREKNDQGPEQLR